MTSSSPPLFAEASDEGWISVGDGVRRRVKLSLPDLMLVEVRFEAGAVGPPHSHPHVQSSFVAEGAFDVRIGEATCRLTKGGAYIVPPGVEHGVVALEAGTLVDSFTPRRDDFL